MKKKKLTLKYLEKQIKELEKKMEDQKKIVPYVVNSTYFPSCTSSHELVGTHWFKKKNIYGQY